MMATGTTQPIVWCNAVSVKIRWDDGEQVTWRRDSLADRPIEILATNSSTPWRWTLTTQPPLAANFAEGEIEADDV